MNIKQAISDSKAGIAYHYKAYSDISEGYWSDGGCYYRDEINYYKDASMVIMINLERAAKSNRYDSTTLNDILPHINIALFYLRNGGVYNKFYDWVCEVKKVYDQNNK